MSTSHSSTPVPVHVLHDLFDFVAARLTERCDNRLRYAREFCRANGLNESEVIEWLEDNGGYCDCEVLMNVVSRCCDPDGDDDHNSTLPVM